nr:VOC family protein [Bradyrhizobium cytisi]
MIEGISAITLAIHDMHRAVQFYRSLGFEILHGGEAALFTSFRAGTGYLNLTVQPDKRWSWWGRVIFYVADVDALYERALAAGWQPSTTHAMPNGASATFISLTSMVTSSVLPGRCPDRMRLPQCRSALVSAHSAMSAPKRCARFRQQI